MASRGAALVTGGARRIGRALVAMAAEAHQRIDVEDNERGD